MNRFAWLSAFVSIVAVTGGVYLSGRSPSEVPRRATYDLLIRGGTIVDGTGAAGYRADIALRGDRIVRIDPAGIDASEAADVLEAEGLIVAPGFIDNHAHIGTNIHERPLAENFLRQGITTILASLHSMAQPWPLGAYAQRLRVAPNIGFFAGHSWIREEVMGMDNRAPTPAELERMKELVDLSMQQGALGLSTGLQYVPAYYAETEEVVELAKVAARHGGIYVSHMRDEARGLIASVAEVIRIADEASIPVQINHHKAAGAAQWGWSRRTLAMIDSARAAGLDVKHDVYPYTAASTGSGVLFPQWALAGGRDSVRARLSDPARRAAIEAEMKEIWQQNWTGDEIERIQFRTIRSMPQYNGRNLRDLVIDRGLAPTLENGVSVVADLQMEGGFSAIYHIMEEEDLIRFLQHPWAMIETDGDPVDYGVGFPHPRSYGAFPRLLQTYVREKQVLTLEDAVRRITSMPADQIGERERGRLREGMLGDITVFDLERVEDLATFSDPHRYPVGIVHVLVNGVPVIRNASFTGERPGRVLTGPARPVD